MSDDNNINQKIINFFNIIIGVVVVEIPSLSLSESLSLSDSLSFTLTSLFDEILSDDAKKLY